MTARTAKGDQVNMAIEQRLEVFLDLGLNGFSCT